MTLRCLFVARPSRYKGLSILLEALTLLPSESCELTILGHIHSQERPLLKSLPAGLVSSLGPQDNDTVAEYLRKSDVLIAPSLYESFGNVALEAMACGVPVIASRCGGLQELVVDGVCGLLVEPGQPQDLVRALKILTHDENFRTRMGQAALKHSRHFHWSEICRQTIRLLDSSYDEYSLPTCAS